ncbi:MAG TPA: hypothetical protein VFQ53_14635 [Kofleriaceae bacterium]|nr:hypothetical protein [Kofleriaceae bacterium]
MARAKPTKTRTAKRSAAEIAAAMVGGAKPAAKPSAKPKPSKATTTGLPADTEKLVALVAESPRDDGARRVLADHLIEHGEAAWGELIVTCLELARREAAGTLDDDEGKALARRGGELFTRHEAQWKALLKGLVYYVSWNGRGVHVSVKHDRLREGLARAVALLPIHTVKVLRFGVRTMTTAMLRQVAEAPVLQAIDRLELELFFDQRSEPGIRAMFGEPHTLLHLRSLAITRGDVSAAALEFLAGLPWQQLARLDFHDALDTGAIASLLAGKRTLPDLRELVVNAALDDDDLAALAPRRIRAIQHERRPGLRLGKLGDAGVKAFARAEHLGLRQLELEHTPKALAMLLAAPAMRTVEVLELHDKLGPQARALADADLPALHTLQLGAATDADLATILDGDALPKLSSLVARDRVGDAGAAAVAASGRKLVGLELGNQLTDTGARALAASAALGDLAQLNLKDNPKLTNDAKRELRAKFGAGVATFSR